MHIVAAKEYASELNERCIATTPIKWYVSDLDSNRSYCNSFTYTLCANCSRILNIYNRVYGNQIILQSPLSKTELSEFTAWLENDRAPYNSPLNSLHTSEYSSLDTSEYSSLDTNSGDTSSS